VRALNGTRTSTGVTLRTDACFTDAEKSGCPLPDTRSPPPPSGSLAAYLQGPPHPRAEAWKWSASALGGRCKRVPFASHWRFKYLMDVDGNSFSRRFRPFLLSNSLVFRATAFREWFDDWIRPGVHYIAITSPDFADVRPQLEWALANDAEARAIADRATRFARRWLRAQDEQCWTFRVIAEYADLLDGRWREWDRADPPKSRDRTQGGPLFGPPRNSTRAARSGPPSAPPPPPWKLPARNGTAANGKAGRGRDKGPPKDRSDARGHRDANGAHHRYRRRGPRTEARLTKLYGPPARGPPTPSLPPRPLRHNTSAAAGKWTLPPVPAPLRMGRFWQSAKC
jgi:hypothetical protein